MLGDGRLRHCELGPDDLRDRPGGLFAVGEQLQDAPAHRVTEDVERVHGTTVPGATYMSLDRGAGTALALVPWRRVRDQWLADVRS